MIASRACLLTSITLSWGHVRGLNRLLFDSHELHGREVRIASEDRRATHVTQILKRQAGDVLRVGLIDGAPTDHARLACVEADGSLRIELPPDLDVRAPPSVPRVHLLLALPRPLQLERILPMVAQLGVGTLVLSSARKVERSYWGSHLFRERGGAEATRAALVDGLMQSGDTALPKVVRARHLHRWCADELDALFPRDQVARVVAHPQRVGLAPHQRLRDMPASSDGVRGQLLVAIGPEGGWEEPDEIDMLVAHGFTLVTLGERVLRSDVAVVSLLTLAHDTISRWDCERAAVNNT